MRIALIQVPYHLGHEGIGMGAGPERLVAAGAAEALEEAGHDVELLRVRRRNGETNEVGASFEVVRRLAETVAGATERSAFPLVLSGNCMSIGRAEVGIVPPAAGAERAGPALDRLRTQVGSVYLHVDLDVLDPTAGRANEYAAPGGLSAEDVEGIVEAVGDRFEVLGPAVTAYDPGADPEARVPALAADIMRRIAATAAANVEAAPR